MASAMREWEKYFEREGKHLVDTQYIGKGIGRSLLICLMRCVFVAGFKVRDSYYLKGNECQESQESLFRS